MPWVCLNAQDARIMAGASCLIRGSHVPWGVSAFSTLSHWWGNTPCWGTTSEAKGDRELWKYGEGPVMASTSHPSRV